MSRSSRFWLPAAGLLACLSLTAPAMAHETSDCTAVPQSRWLPVAQVKQHLLKQGYQIRKIKVSGSCYELYGRDPKGKRGEFFFDPSNGKLKFTDD